MTLDARLATSFRTHPKRIKLQRRLGCEAVLALIDLILFATQSKPSGVLTGMSAEDISIASQWSGDAESFVATLVETRFLDRNANDEFELHDWSEHNPYAAFGDRRTMQAKANAHVGWLKRKGTTCALRNCQLCKLHADGKRSSKIGKGSIKNRQCSTSPSSSPSTSKESLSSAVASKKKFDDDSVPYRLSSLLLSEIRKNDPAFKEPNLQTWAVSFDALIRIDKRDPQEIAKLVRWCQQDPFWMSNVLSAAKFRKQYTTLKLKRESGDRTPPSTPLQHHVPFGSK